MKLKQGVLIVIEGIDGAGKTTQAKRLLDTLLDKGMEAVSLGRVGMYVLSGGVSIIYSAVALLLSVLVLKRKGVRKTTGE